MQLQVSVGSTPASSFLWPLCTIRQNQIQTEEFCVVRTNPHFILKGFNNECEHKFIIIPMSKNLRTDEYNRHSF